MVLAAFLFMRKMIRTSNVNILTDQLEDNGNTPDNDLVSNYTIPKAIEVFEITGPLFFGAAYKFKDAIRFVKKTPQVFIIRMRQVPIIDATGIKTLEEVYKDIKHRGAKLILAEVHSQQVMQEIKDSRLLFAIGKANVTQTLEGALQRANIILSEKVD
ncbi:MAG: sodium-independent anion transporter, partial [Panacibacter sp.]